jgi:hypothetical protein
LTDLLRDRGAEDCEEQRHLPVHHAAALGFGKLGNFGCKAERADAVHSGIKAGSRLAAHRRTVQSLHAVEQCIKDRVDT